MRNIYLFITISIVIQACSSKESNLQCAISSDQLSIIRMPDSYTYETNLNSIFEQVEYIPLESSKDCHLVNPRKAAFRDNRYYILDFRRGLYVFDKDGNYLHKIGMHGRGPGEIMDINDFDFDEQGNVLILDYKRILRYSSDGKFLDIYSKFDFTEDDFYANLYQFAFISPSNFYVWSGTLGIKEQKENHFAMYYMNNGKLVKGFFPLRYKLSDKQHRFIRSTSEILITPVLGNDTIYSINEDEVLAKYDIKFKHNIEGNSIPSKIKSLSTFGLEAFNNEKVSYNIMNPLETQSWLSFAFTHKKTRVITLYNKKSDAIHTLKGFRPNTAKSSILMPYYFHFMHDDYFCSIIPAREFLLIDEGITKSQYPIKYINNGTGIVKQNDNHVIIKYKTK